MSQQQKKGVNKKNLFMTLPYPQCEGKDEDTDVVEEDDGHESVHVALKIARRGELLGDETLHADAGMDETFHGPIEKATEENADEKADGDIA